jgi:hypothetical protein
MEGMTEKLTIRVTESGLTLQVHGGAAVELTAVEALMLLDILRDEERTLQELAEKASPLPFRMRILPEQ